MKKKIILGIIILLAILAIIAFGFTKGNPIGNETLSKDNYEKLITQYGEKYKDSDNLLYFTYATTNYMFSDGFSSIFNSNLTEEEKENDMYKQIYGKTINELIQEGKKLMEENNTTPQEYKEKLQNISNTTTTSTNTITETKTEKEKKYINLDETVEDKDWNVALKNVYFGQRIDPPEPNEYFSTYYQVKDTDNTYLCVVLDATNTSNLELSAEKAATINIKYDNNYNYTGFSVVAENGDFSIYANIKPLMTKQIYYLIEVPKIVEDNTDKPIEIEIKCGNNTYYYQYR